jgi:hypothetical protein
MTKILLAYSWGHRNPHPGLSNEFMAREIAHVRGNYDFLLMQVEIAEAMKTSAASPDYVIGKMGEYMNTHDVTELMASWLKNKGIDLGKAELTVACHATHWRGCQLVLRKFGLKAHRLPMKVPYDPESAHWYTRSWWQAFLGKLVHGVTYLLRGQLGISWKGH